MKRVVESVSIALLRAEWTPHARGGFTCPCCGGMRPMHENGCDMDLSLAERGFAEQANRDAARRCLELSKQPTIPAPPSKS